MKALILGVGNPGRGDDGLGPALVARLAGVDPGALVEDVIIGAPGGPSAVWKYQLAIEDAYLIKDLDLVVFADASGVGDEPVSLAEISPAASVSFTTHELSPGAVLALCEELYGRAPKAYLLAIRGYAWDLGEGLSGEAEKSLGRAAAALGGFLKDVIMI